MKHWIARLAASVFATSLLSPIAANNQFPTATPIKHVVVIFGENISFDHYFGTYPFALNPPDEPRFTAVPGTSVPPVGACA